MCLVTLRCFSTPLPSFWLFGFRSTLCSRDRATTSSERQTARCFSPGFITLSPANTHRKRELVWERVNPLSLSPTHSHSLRFWLSLFGHDENGRLLGLIRWGMLLREETPFCRRCSLKKTVPSSSPYVIQSPPEHQHQHWSLPLLPAPSTPVWQDRDDRAKKGRELG